MINIPSTFFVVTNQVSIISYNGKYYKPDDTIEIKNEDISNFNHKWLKTLGTPEKPEKTINLEPIKEIKEVTKTEITESESKEEKKSVRGRRKVI